MTDPVAGREALERVLAKVEDLAEHGHFYERSGGYLDSCREARAHLASQDRRIAELERERDELRALGTSHDKLFPQCKVCVDDYIEKLAALRARVAAFEEAVRDTKAA